LLREERPKIGQTHDGRQAKAGKWIVRLTIASGVLKDEKFLATCVNENTPDRQVIYEDPKPGFCICAHVNRDAREVNPHDYGTSWPIYGQAFGETELTISPS